MSKLAPEQGELPTKIALEGVEQGSPAAQQLIDDYGGAIRHFHNKARQQRLLSGASFAAMHAPLPQGGRMTYSFNDGQEVIRLNVRPQGSPSPQPPPERKFPGRADPTLAIDILFTNELYEAYDVVAIDRVVTIPGGTNPGTGGEWDVQYFGTLESAMKPWRESSFTFNYSEGTIRIDYVYQKKAVIWYEDLLAPRNREFFEFDGPIDGYTVFAWCKFSNREGTEWDSRVSFIEIGDYQPGSGPSTYPPRTDRYYKREVRTMFDVLIPAGAVGNPLPPEKSSEKPYEAEALGRTGNHEDDRLIPCAEMQIAKSCQREFTITKGPDPAGGGGETGPQPGPIEADAPEYWVGQGFLARPHKEQIAGFPVEKTIIYLYLASSNNIQQDQFPGGSPRYDLHKEFIKGNVMVRVREFAQVAPVGVRVDVKTQMERRTYSTPNANQSPYKFDLQEIVPSTPDRTGTWVFAAGANWTDGGNEPAEPERKDGEGKAMMGTLLAEKEIDFAEEFPAPPGEPPAENVFHVQPMEPVQSKLYTEPDWPGKILVNQQTKEGDERMHFLCRIEWTPPEEVYLTGSAKISTAKLNPNPPPPPPPPGP